MSKKDEKESEAVIVTDQVESANVEDNALVVAIKTLPVIKERIKETGAQVKVRIAELNLDSIEATEDNLKIVTDTHAVLNKEFNEYEDQRKAVKAKLTSPLTEMLATYKEELTIPYGEALNKLKDKKSTIVEELLVKKEAALSGYFTEYAMSEKLSYISWKKYKDLKNIALVRSKTDAKYKEEIGSFIENIKSDLQMISGQPHQAEILTEYKKTYNCSDAVIIVQDRKAAEKKEEDKLQEMELQRRLGILNKEGFKLNEDDTILIHSDLEVQVTWKEVAEADEKAFSKIMNEKRAVIAALKVRKASAEIKEQPKAAPVAPKQEVPATPPVEETPKPVLAAPVVQDTLPETLVVEFRITDTLIKIKSVKQFMIDNNINFENID